ncbi:hypothetical protein ACFV4M_25950 [Kitasatospora indigofera]|uniref:hypothetical protein n=1 Tax=Kitasatospora indigofera TaxID=67307 RepID=UPI0036475912
MATPRHPFHIDGPKPIDGAPENLAKVVVSFSPATHPEVLIRWTYTLQDGQHLKPCGVTVEPAPGLPPDEWPHIGATLMRELPLAKLERAARSALAFGLRTPDGTPLPWSVSTPAADIPAVARETVRERHPDVDPDSGAAAARRWKRLVRLAEVVLELQAAEARGEKSPTAVVAEARGVAQPTVRSWLHQAKKEGFVAAPFAEFTAIGPGESQADE